MNRPLLARQLQTGAAGRMLLLLIAVFLLGAGAGLVGYLSLRRQSAPLPLQAAPEPQALSANTRSILAQLPGQVEIRFYSVLQQDVAAESLVAFSARVDRLLGEFAKEAEGRIHLKRIQQSADGTIDAIASTVAETTLNIDDPSDRALLDPREICRDAAN